MRIQCGTCLTKYSSLTYYRQHLNYQSKRRCFEAYHAGTSHPQEVADDSSSDDATTSSDHNTGNVPSLAALSHVPSAGRMSAVDEIIERQRETLLSIERNSSLLLGASASNAERMCNERGNLCNDQENLRNEATFGTNEDNDSEYDTQVNADAGSSMLVQFKEYRADVTEHCVGFDKNEEAGIQLMSMLGKRKCPLGLYEEILKWHRQNLHAKTVTPRSTLMKKLNQRYNREAKKPFVKEVTLPHSKAVVEIVLHDFEQQLQSLLTDPRIKDEDYLFFDDNPFQGPPENSEHIGDFNTGDCFKATYHDLIEDPTKEILCGVYWYLDAAVSGQYDNLPIEALQFSLAIFTMEARNKRHCWRTIGYVTKFLREKTAAEEILLESEHIDRQFFFGVHHWSRKDAQKVQEDTEEVGRLTQNSAQETQDGGSDEEEFPENGPRFVTGVVTDLEEDEEDIQGEEELDSTPLPSCHAQDLHAMLDVMLEPYRRVERQEGGTLWDFHYRGVTYFNTHFRIFTAVVKGDTQEADKHCGKFTSRGKSVAHLCRYCCCPNAETDEPYSSHERKTPAMIQPLVEAQDTEALQAMSQQMIDNVWYSVKFGSHNDTGIHGATLLEILHWLQLGKYKYDRSSFFEQTGKDSILSEQINNFSKMTSMLYRRQSDRDLPRTNFNKGIKRGKLMAHEMSGLILVLLTVIRSTQGREALLNHGRGKGKGTQKEHFDSLQKIRDWVRLLELLLMMEEWLNQRLMKRFEIIRFRTKIREILALEKRVAKRVKGMGFKTFNFHAALHLADDMLAFGVCFGTDTQSNEKMHQAGKTAATKTQKIPATFDYQVAKRLHDLDTVDFAMDEINGGRPMFDYSHDLYASSSDDDEEETATALGTKLGGSCVQIYHDEETDDHVIHALGNRIGIDKHDFDEDLTLFLVKEFIALPKEVQKLCIYAEHSRFGQIFRANPLYRGSPWNDWVMIQWDNSKTLPAQIACFVDLRDIPDNDHRPAGIYAVVESATENKESKEKNLSDLFTSYTKDVKYNKDGKVERVYYMVDADSIVSTACLIPDIGNPSNRKRKAAYLKLLPRNVWASRFATWLAKPHAREYTEA